MPPPFTPNDVAAPRRKILGIIANLRDQTSFFGVLQIIPVGFGQPTVHGLFHPNDFVNQFITLVRPVARKETTVSDGVLPKSKKKNNGFQH